MRTGTPNTDESVILVGGLGTRLRSVIGAMPKPLAPVCGRPFLAWILDALARQGMRRIVLATGFGADQVEAALGDRWNGMELVYSREKEPLGTGGAVKKAAGELTGDAFFVLNGDTWLTLDYTTFDECVRNAGARFGIALASVPDVARYGSVCVEQGRVTRFVEKGRTGPGQVNAGVYRMDRSLLSGLPDGVPFSFESEVMMPLVSREPILAYQETSDFIDIGVPDDYARAQNGLGQCAAGS